MIIAHGRAVRKPGGPFLPFVFTRREPGPHDVLIEILYAGVCHSDIHSVRGEWGDALFPMVPGHEILGLVTAVGRSVKRFKAGDLAGVGCFVDSCRKCDACRAHEEQHCAKVTFTYNSHEADGKTPTYGGYSDRIVVDETYAFRIRAGQPLERVAPLLCAGITTYSPLKRAGVKRGTKLGVAGLGGLGHMAVKIGAALGAKVTVFSTSAKKEKSAKALGAAAFVNVKKSKDLAKAAGTQDVIIDTIAARHDPGVYLNCLRTGGTLALVGAAPEPLPVSAFALIMGRKTLSGSLIGGLKETQEMLDFCASRKILADVEVISPSDIDRAHNRAVAGDVRYRFVIDMKKK